jgi:hypothetical protein
MFMEELRESSYIEERLNRMSAQLDTLTAEVAKLFAVADRAISLLGSLSAQISAAGTEDDLAALTASIDAETAKLSAAIAPSVPPAVAPVPAPPTEPTAAPAA